MQHRIDQPFIPRYLWTPRNLRYRLATLSPRVAKRVRLIGYPSLGVLIGLLILHPFSMLVCQLSGMLGVESVGAAVVHAFHPSMWLMWLFYSGLGGLGGFLAALLVNRIRLVEGFIRICAWCGRIHVPGERPDEPATWKRLDFYLLDEEVQESHGVCPDCSNDLRQMQRSVRTRRE